MNEELANPLFRNLDSDLARLDEPDRIRRVSFSFSSESQADVEMLTALAESDGFQVDVHPPGGHQTLWVIEVLEEAVLTPEYVRSRWRAWAEVAASAPGLELHGFSYDDADPTIDDADSQAIAEGRAVRWPRTN
jgi:hypothetical protein